MDFGETGMDSRKHRLGRAIFLLLWTATVLYLIGCEIHTHPENTHLVLLHVNDTHGHLYPHDYLNERDVGGAARLAALIKGIRRENPRRTLVLHAGDIFSRGGPLTVYYAGKVDMLTMQAMGVDAMVPGNGEFYTGVDNLLSNAAEVDFPVVMANIYYKDNGERLFPPYVIQDIAGLRIALLGLGFFNDKHPASWHLMQKHPVPIAQALLSELRGRVDLVIALTHLGVSVDTQLAGHVSGIDVIVGGHSHKFFTRPQVLPGPGNTEVIYVQAGIFGIRLGRLDLFVERDADGGYTVNRVEGQLIPITREVEDDAEVAQLLERFSPPLKEVLCVSRITLEMPPAGSSPMGEFLAEAIHQHFSAEITLLFRNAVHSGILPGPVTVADVCRVHQWRSRILRMSLTGAQLQEVLGAQEVFASGCMFQKSEDRIWDLKIDGSPVALNRSYRVVADEALVMNTDSLQGIDFEETGERVDSLLIKHLRKLRVIDGNS
jgi:5'-nucleotidase/UDP-sugar diphosphatase